MLTQKRSRRTSPKASRIYNDTCPTLRWMESWASWAGFKPKGRSRYPASPKSAQPLKGRQTYRAAVCTALGAEGTKEGKGELLLFPGLSNEPELSNKREGRKGGPMLREHRPGLKDHVGVPGTHAQILTFQNPTEDTVFTAYPKQS